MSRNLEVKVKIWTIYPLAQQFALQGWLECVKSVSDVAE